MKIRAWLDEYQMIETMISLFELQFSAIELVVVEDKAQGVTEEEQGASYKAPKPVIDISEEDLTATIQKGDPWSLKLPVGKPETSQLRYNINYQGSAKVYVTYDKYERLLKLNHESPDLPTGLYLMFVKLID